MEHLIGNKSRIAVQIDIAKQIPLEGRIALWVCDEYFGDFDSRNYLCSTINALKRIVQNQPQLWEEEFENMSPVQIFKTRDPFYNNPEDFYDLSEEEQIRFEKYDKFILGWGSEFNGKSPDVFVHEGDCLFIWVQGEIDANGKYLPISDDEIKFGRVSSNEVRAVYLELLTLITDVSSYEVQ